MSVHIALKDTGRVFARKKQLSAVYGIFVFMQIAFLSWELYKFHIYQQYTLTLREILKPCIIGVAIFIFLGYELAVSLWENKLHESLQVMARGVGATAASILILLVCLAVICSLVELAGLMVLFGMTGIRFAPFLWHNIKIVLLYILAPAIIGGFSGCALAALFKTKRVGAYLCAIIFLLLNTDFAEPFLNIPYNYFNGAEEATNFLYQLKRFFTLVPVSISSTYAIDSLYGVPMEPVRWLLSGFWLILSFVIFCLGLWGSFPSKKVVYGAAVVILSAFGIYIFSGLDNVLVFDKDMSGYAEADQMYYILDNEQESEEEDPGFSISAYAMTLDINKKLRAEVTASLDIADKNREELHFTLYHGYALSSIQLLDGTEIPFDQQGDTVTVFTADLGMEDTIVFRYKGYSAKYYSTSQAIFLPAYFPYYPVAGIRNVWDEEKIGTNTDITESEAQFSVEVNTPNHVYSNLDGDGKSFAGTAQGVTICAGLVTQEENIIYAPLKYAPVTFSALEEMNMFLEQIWEDYLLPYERPDLTESLVFQTPENYTINSYTEDIVFCGDHIFMSSSDAYSMCMEILKMIIPCCDSNEPLQGYVASYLVYEQEIMENHKLGDRTVEELVAGLEDFERMDEEDRFINQYELIYPALYYIFNESNDVQALWNYFSGDSRIDYVEYLIQLLEG